MRTFIEIRVTRSEFDEKKLEKAAMTQIFFRYFSKLSEKIYAAYEFILVFSKLNTE